MPNLRPPVTSVAMAQAYRERILQALPPGAAFEPLMTLYLTDNTPAAEIAQARASGFVHAVKYYPAGATTNSDSGVTAIERAFPALEAMERHDLPLLVHGEVTAAAIDVFDRERVFLETELPKATGRFPALRVVVEHVTTAETADLVRAHAPRVAATITPHHLVINRTSLFQGGLRPHLYCLPVAKRERHRQALRKAATSGESCFFLGTDTAPHLKAAKEAACGCAGIFVGPTALQTYAQVFEEENALDNLESFASLNGPRFYRLRPNAGTLVLRQQPSRAPASVGVDQEEILVFRGGESLPWSVAEVRP